MGSSCPRVAKQPSRRDLPQSLALFLFTGSRGCQQPLSNPTRSAHPPSGTSAGLDLSNLDTIVQEFSSAGLAPSTLKSYRSGRMRFLHFCDQYKLSPPFPVTERTLVFFVAFLYKDSLSSGTIKSYLAAVRHTQFALGLGDPHSGELPQLENVIKGSKKKTAKASCTRLPITPKILVWMRGVWQGLQDQHHASMLWAAVRMCFCGFLRAQLRHALAN